MEIATRVAEASDNAAIESLYRSAFPVEERDLVTSVAVDLLRSDFVPEVLSLIAEVDGEVAGHVAFSPVVDSASDEAIGAILAPLAVCPALQRRGIGTTLVKAGIRQLSASGIDLFFVYGDPAFYARYGFDAKPAQRYRPACPLTQPHGWQALAVNDEVEGDGPVTIRCVPTLERAELW